MTSHILHNQLLANSLFNPLYSLIHIRRLNMLLYHNNRFTVTLLSTCETIANSWITFSGKQFLFSLPHWITLSLFLNWSQKTVWTELNENGFVNLLSQLPEVDFLKSSLSRINHHNRPPSLLGLGESESCGALE